MYCALLVTGIVITSEKPFKFLANGSSLQIDVKIYPTYEDYLQLLNMSISKSFAHNALDFSFNRDKAVGFWKS